MLSDAVIAVMIRNPFTRGWLNLRLRPLITRTLRGIIGHDFTLLFATDEADAQAQAAQPAGLPAPANAPPAGAGAATEQ